MKHTRHTAWCLPVLLAVSCVASSVAQGTSASLNSPSATHGSQTSASSPAAEKLTVLRGNTRALSRATDLGEVQTSAPTGRMVLWLRRSAEQQAELSQFLSHVQDPASPQYHHWKTPGEFGKAYGVSDRDLAQVQQWLQSTGLQIERVSTGRNAIVFTGSTGSLSSAFHTSFHKFMVGQQEHVSNISEPQIPSALAGVIAGVSPLNDFHPKPMHVTGRSARYDQASNRLKPALTVDQGGQDYLFVTPADASIIYNTPTSSYNPSATQNFDGTGVNIGILGYSGLVLQDVQNYRKAFLPASAAGNLPHVILDGGVDPGVMNGGNAVESLLDVEVAGGLAPGAAINYYYAASTDLSDGLILSGLRALEENKVSILSVSYGACEADLGAGGNLAFSELWQQAAAQGISVTVSTGDSGSATCDGDSGGAVTQASEGLSVNGLASTPYNIAVGGTDFYPLANDFSTYVNTASGTYPGYATALRYIPENPWNDSSITLGPLSGNSPAYGASGTDIIGGGGGLSSQAYCSQALDAYGYCDSGLTGYAQPAYQAGLVSGSVRTIPDVSLLAGNGFYGAAWAFCADAATEQAGGVSTDCQTDANNHLLDGAPISAIGGTSAAAPAFAGMLALISQSQGGVRLGQANTVLYNLASSSSSDPNSPGKYQLGFHDVTLGNNSVYCASGTQDCGSNNFMNGYDATPGYDPASGLGSVNLAQLISLWPTTGFNATSNIITAGTSAATLSTSAISVVHGTPLYFGDTVTPGTATGQFSLLLTNSLTAANSADFGMLGPNATGSLVTNDLPGGSYAVSAYYAGDTSNTGSRSSNSVTLNISAEPSTLQLFFGEFDPLTGSLGENYTTLPYGVHSYISAEPYGQHSTADANGNLIPDGVPTGNVTFTTNGKSQSVALSSLGIAQISASAFPPGTYTYQASYAGDASFAASSSSTQTLTITKGATSFTLDPSSATAYPLGATYLTVVLQTDSVALYPTGAVSASVNGHTYAPNNSSQTTVGGVDAIAFLFVIPPTDLKAGSNVVNVSYGGDANYQPATGGGTITLNVAGSFDLAGPTQPVMVRASQQGSTTVSVTPSSGFTGQVNMACSVSPAPYGHTPICAAAPVTIYGTDPASTTVLIDTYDDTPAGTYTLTLTGSSSQATRSITIAVQVTAGPGFTLSAANSPITLGAPGQSATTTLTLTATQGYSGTVVLGCTITPVQASGSAPICTVPGSVALNASTANAMLQISTTSATVAGSYNVSITATSGLLQQVLTVPLVLQQVAPAAGFTLSAANDKVIIATSGQSVADTLTVKPSGGFTGTVQLSCSVSAGTSASSAGLPTCVLPSSLSVSGTSPVSATVTINTTSSSLASNRATDGIAIGKRIGGLAFACLLLTALPRRRRLAGLLCVVLMSLIFGITGCSNDGGSGSKTGAPGTSAGTYAVTVTATSGSVSSSTQIMLTVQ